MNTNNATTIDSGASVEDRIENVLFGDDAPVDDQKPKAQPQGDVDLDTDDQVTDDQAGVDAEPGTLAEYLGVAEDQVIETEDGKVFINVKVDGEQMQVPMQEVIKSYQLQKHVNNKSMQLSEHMKQAQQEYLAIRSEATNRFHILDKMTEALEAQFTAQYRQVDWNRLRAENPAEFVALQKDFEMSQNQIRNAKQITLQQKQQIAEIERQREEALFQSNLFQQAEMALQAFPEWKDPVARQRETSAMRSFLSESYGYTEEDLNAVTDFRALQVIRDAMAYRQGKTVADKKVEKPVPKFQKAGRPAAAMAQMREAKARRSSLKTSGSVDDAAALILSRM